MNYMEGEGILEAFFIMPVKLVLARIAVARAVMRSINIIILSAMCSTVLLAVPRNFFSGFTTSTGITNWLMDKFMA